MPALALGSIQRHKWAMELSGELTQTWREMHRPMAVDVSPNSVIAALNGAGIRPVLMGAHGLSGWRPQPRATKDVDVLVRKKDIRKAIRALRAAFPTLLVQETPIVARFIDPEVDDAVIDLMKPTQEVFRLVFRQTIAVGRSHEIPNLEMGLISKFAAMTSPDRRRARKGQDVIDFMEIVEHNQDRLDRKKLRRLADREYSGGSAEIEQLIDDILAGREITI